jgi:hypothetical protein
MDGQGAAQGLTVRPSGGAATFARIPSRDEEVEFRNGDTTLAGTFIAPATPGPHPAIVLLHGSGPLTRHSFGPWPRFFNSLFPHAGHSLMETPSRKGMAPGVFAFLRQGLVARIRFSDAAAVHQ